MFGLDIILLEDTVRDIGQAAVLRSGMREYILVADSAIHIQFGTLNFGVLCMRLMMIKIDYKQFIKDRIWFGWFFSYAIESWIRSRNPYLKLGIQVR